MIRKLITTNQREKIGSLAVAVALWAFAMSGATRTGIFPTNIPVHTLNVPPGLAAAVEVDVVRVRISAGQLVWRQLTPASFRATLDLSGRSTGGHDVPVRIETLVPNVQVIDVIPKSVAVQLESQVLKTLPVEVRTQGDPADGFFASEATADPATVTVVGATSELERLERVIAVLDVSGADDLREGTVAVQAIDGSGRPLERVTVTPNKLFVRQMLTKLAATKPVGVRVVTTGTPPAGKLITPVETKPATVTAAGSEQRLATMSSVPTQPIDLSKLSSRTTVTALLDVPRGITITDSTEVQVTFEVSDQDAVKTVLGRYEYLNLPADRRIGTADPASATVVVRGAASRLTALTGADVIVGVDLAGAGVGDRRIDLATPAVRLPDGVTLQQLVTTAVTVKIE